PEDALQSVRTAMMLGAVLPEMRQEAEALANDLAELVRVRRETTEEISASGRTLAALSYDRQRMGLLVEERQKKQTETERALAAERQRATELARKAATLKDLIAKLEQDAAKAGRLSLATQNDPGRLAPSIAFATAKGLLPLPVNGVKVRQFGAADRLGSTEKGISIATRS